MLAVDELVELVLLLLVDVVVFVVVDVHSEKFAGQHAPPEYGADPVSSPRSRRKSGTWYAPPHAIVEWNIARHHAQPDCSSPSSQRFGCIFQAGR